MLKRILIIAGLLIVTIATVGLWWLQKEGVIRVINGNKVTVSADLPLSADKVKIEFGVSVNTINRQNDLELFDNPEKYTVLYDGGNQNRPKTDFGENDFLITYDDTYYLSFRHFIQTDFRSDIPPSHKYYFTFFIKDNKPTVKVRIDSEEQMNFERQLINKRLAENYRCNVPVDSAGVMFNMIELVPDKK